MKIHSLGYIGVNSTDPSRWAEYGTKVLGMMDVTAQLANGPVPIWWHNDGCRIW